MIFLGDFGIYLSVRIIVGFIFDRDMRRKIDKGFFVGDCVRDIKIVLKNVGMKRY